MCKRLIERAVVSVLTITYMVPVLGTLAALAGGVYYSLRAIAEVVIEH